MLIKEEVAPQCSKHSVQHKFGNDLLRGMTQARQSPNISKQPTFLEHRYDAAGHCIPRCLATVYQLNHGKAPWSNAFNACRFQFCKVCYIIPQAD